MADKKNPLKRVHKKLDKHICDIIQYRDKNGLDTLKITQITHLISKHRLFIKIKNDIAIVKNYKEGIKNE